MILEISKERKVIQIKHYLPKSKAMKKQEPTPLKGYEVRMINRYSVIVILIIIAISLWFSSCSIEEKLTDYYPLDGRVTWQGDGYLMLKVGNDTIKLTPPDDTFYFIGDLIPARQEFRTIHALKH